MKLRWILVLILMVLVALFSVQNATPISVRFLVWEFSMSAALVILLAAMLGALVGLIVGTFGGRRRNQPAPMPAATTEEFPPRGSNFPRE